MARGKRTKERIADGTCKAGLHVWIDGQERCELCNITAHRKWNGANSEYYRERDLKSNYGMTLDDYNEMLASQNGVCAICHKTCPTGRNLGVDHNHVTNKVRGLLCINCNRFVGVIENNPARTQAVLDYIVERN